MSRKGLIINENDQESLPVLARQILTKRTCQELTEPFLKKQFNDSLKEIKSYIDLFKLI